ncbi:MAG: hypothetical protein FWC91_08400, partial [Defluviitaleaceae bacterium]|nr:hypothetical protein [Defluviitaleaceae bacterium]
MDGIFLLHLEMVGVFSIVIIFQEIKKIFNIRILIAIAAVCIVFYLILMDIRIRYYPGWQHGSELVEFMHELADQYGTRITPDEIEYFLSEKWLELLSETEGQELNVISMGDDFRFRMQALGNIERFWDETRVELGEFASVDYNMWHLQILQDVFNEEDVPSFINEHLALLIAHADILIQNSQLFAKYEITNYEEFLVYRSTGLINYPVASRDRSHMNVYLSRQENNFVNWKIIDLINIKDMYDFSYNRDIFSYHLNVRKDFVAGRILSDRGRYRVIDVLETNEYWNVMDEQAFRNTIHYFRAFSRLQLLVIFVLILPFLAYDRMRNLVMLQYSTAIGRKLKHRQLAATAISAIIISTLLLVIFSIIYSTTGIFRYWNHEVVSFANPGTILFFRFTFGQYFSLLMAMTYIIGIGASFIAFVISRFS